MHASATEMKNLRSPGLVALLTGAQHYNPVDRRLLATEVHSRCEPARIDDDRAAAFDYSKNPVDPPEIRANRRVRTHPNTFHADARIVRMAMSRCSAHRERES
jgi:hypothetical protein